MATAEPIDPSSCMDAPMCFPFSAARHEASASSSCADDGQTMDDDDCFGSGADADTELSPIAHARPRRRAVAQPQRLDALPPALCYKYEQGRAAAGAGRWQGRKAHLRYYLPENWSPSYRFTVFEDSYILSIARDLTASAEPSHGAGSPALERPPPTWLAPVNLEPPQPPSPLPSSAHAYHLARPLHSGAATSGGGAPAAAEFELVWPVEVDQALLEAVEAACDRVVPGAKRKPHGAIPNLNGVNLKMQKLGVW
jgi:hypothetical protein